MGVHRVTDLEKFPVRVSRDEAPMSFCQKRRWQVTAKHAYTLRMWLCMTQSYTEHGCMVYTERAEIDSLWQQILVAPALPAL